jgi:hypothetical protein
MKWKVRTTTAINQNNGKNPRHVGDEEDAFMTPFHSKSPLPGCWLILGIPIPSVSTTRLHSIRPPDAARCMPARVDVESLVDDGPELAMDEDRCLRK